MKNTSIKTVVAIGIGAALFFVLGRFVAIPSGVPNTNISLQYAVLGLLAAMYGPLAGGLDRLHRPYADRPELGRQPLVELGHRQRLRGRGGRPVLQEDCH